MDFSGELGYELEKIFPAVKKERDYWKNRQQQQEYTPSPSYSNKNITIIFAAFAYIFIIAFLLYFLYIYFKRAERTRRQSIPRVTYNSGKSLTN